MCSVSNSGSYAQHLLSSFNSLNNKITANISFDLKIKLELVEIDVGVVSRY